MGHISAFAPVICKSDLWDVSTIAGSFRFDARGLDNRQSLLDIGFLQ
jgi:hypothetical protein